MPIFLQPLVKYADFSGRASRTEFWSYMLFYVIAYLLAMQLFLIIGFPQLIMLVALATVVPNLAVAVRRLHDINYSGWWFLIGFVPFLNLVLLVFYCLPAKNEGNRFGPAPTA